LASCSALLTSAGNHLREQIEKNLERRDIFFPALQKPITSTLFSVLQLNILLRRGAVNDQQTTNFAGR
jgi:hypothetical protein